MRKTIYISCLTVLLIVSPLNGEEDGGGDFDIVDQLSELVGDAPSLDALSGLVNGTLGPEFYNSLNLDSVFSDFTSYSDELNSLLGVLGITGNINCFVDVDVNPPIDVDILDRICKPVSSSTFGLDDLLSGKIEVPGIGSIGCDVTTDIDPIDALDPCAISEEKIDVLRNPSKPDEGNLRGGGVVMTPQRSLSANKLLDTIYTVESPNIKKSAPDVTRYKNGATQKDVSRSLDVSNIFKHANNVNSPLAEAITSDNPEVYAMIREYLTSQEAKNNALDAVVGGGWGATPSVEQLTKEALKARPDYFGLPQTNQDVQDAVASMGKLLAEEFPYTDFSKSLEVYLGVEYGKINENRDIDSVTLAKEEETKVFNTFVEGEVQVESKSAIEMLDAQRFAAIEKMAFSSGRLAAPTQERLELLPEYKKLEYVALANKQMTRDAYIASISSRITKLKKKLLNLKIEKTRVCASRFYDNIADSELNKIINAADALAY